MHRQNIIIPYKARKPNLKAQEKKVYSHAPTQLLLKMHRQNIIIPYKARKPNLKAQEKKVYSHAPTQLRSILHTSKPRRNILKEPRYLNPGVPQKFHARVNN